MDTLNLMNYRNLPTFPLVRLSFFTNDYSAEMIGFVRLPEPGLYRYTCGEPDCTFRTAYFDLLSRTVPEAIVESMRTHARTHRGVKHRVRVDRELREREKR